MPIVFVYGSLELEEVQLAVLGRRPECGADALPGHRRIEVPIEDPRIVATLGRTHHADLQPGAPGDAVPGTALEVTEPEVAVLDVYEAEFGYRRIRVRLASGREGWAYARSRPSRAAG